MVIVMEKGTAESNVERVMSELISRGYDVHRSTGTEHTVLGVVGDVAKLDTREFELFDGVQEVVRISEPYKLVGHAFKREKTVVLMRRSFGSISSAPSSVAARTWKRYGPGFRFVYEAMRRVPASIQSRSKPSRRY